MMRIHILLVLLLLPVAAQAQEGCYIGEHNDFVCNKLNMENIVTPPKRFEKTVANVDTDTKVPLPPPTYYPPDAGGGTIPVAGPVDVSAPPKECEGEWKIVAADQFGWYDIGRSPNANRPANRKALNALSKTRAPDGSMAIQHQIKKGSSVGSPELDSPVLYSKPGYCAVMLRYKMFNEKGKYRVHPGKYMSLMGGRGQHGGYYIHAGPAAPPEGWSHYSYAPPVGAKGRPDTKNGIEAAIGSANRSALGATCTNHSAEFKNNTTGSDPINGDKQRCFEKHYGTRFAINTGRWLTVELVSVMNDKNKANGIAYHTLDGKELSRRTGVMWAFNPELSPHLWMRWRMMYGGNPEQLPPLYDMKEWFKDFELLIIEK